MVHCNRVFHLSDGICKYDFDLSLWDPKVNLSLYICHTRINYEVSEPMRFDISCYNKVYRICHNDLELDTKTYIVVVLSWIVLHLSMLKTFHLLRYKKMWTDRRTDKAITIKIPIADPNKQIRALVPYTGQSDLKSNPFVSRGILVPVQQSNLLYVTEKTIVTWSHF